MANINELQCLQDAGNTGVGTCFFDPKNIIGAFVSLNEFELDTTDLQASLIAATHDINKATRLFPIYDFENTADATEKPVIQTMQTGAKHWVRDGFNDWTFQFVNGGLSLLKQLRKFPKSGCSFFFVDASMNIIGLPGSSDTTLKSIPSTGGMFLPQPFKLADGSKITAYEVQFVFNTTYVNDTGAFVHADFDLPSTVNGLQDVNLSNPGAAAAGVFKVVAKLDATGTNMADLYPTELASGSLWTAKNAATGAAIDIDSVTLSTDADKHFVITLDTGDSDYPTPVAPVLINLAAPATLEAAGVDGYESTGAVSIATVA